MNKSGAGDPSRLVQDYLPLTPIAFDILLSLARGARHGYAILLDIEGRTGGSLSAHAGTLYRALARLVESGLVVEVAQPPDVATGDARRRYYDMTPLGRSVAAAEAARLEERVVMARAVRLLRRPREA